MLEVLLLQDVVASAPIDPVAIDAKIAAVKATAEAARSIATPA